MTWLDNDAKWENKIVPKCWMLTIKVPPQSRFEYPKEVGDYQHGTSILKVQGQHVSNVIEYNIPMYAR